VYATVAELAHPPGPITVTVSVPVPVLGVVRVNAVPDVGVEFERVPRVVIAASDPAPPVSVAVKVAAVPWSAL
jgi:hypothetical protein